MTFRVEDLTVSLLPEQMEIDGADCTECSKCTKCTARTGSPTDCSCPSENECACPICPNESSEAPGSSPNVDNHLEALRTQLDEFLASVR
jgi:hypothetical protein